MNYAGNYPKTNKEWWKLVDEFWPQLIGILNRFIGMDDHENVDQQITECKRSEEIAKMKLDRNPHLAIYFQAAWSNAPDVPGLHEIPGWYLLCDLCSESDVLNKGRK